MQGFVLLPVVLVLVVVAALAFFMGRSGGVAARVAGNQVETDRARAVAEAALAHGLWTLDRLSGCSGYPATLVPQTAFGADGYSVTLSPTAGSPVTLTATATLASGAKHVLRQAVSKTYGPALTYTLQPGAGGKDTYIDQQFHGRNFGGATDLWAYPAFDMPLVQFDLSTLPAGSKTSSAQLQLLQTGSTGGGAGETVSIHRVTRAWAEGTLNGPGPPDGATWYTVDGTRPWSVPGGDYDPSPAASAPHVTSNGWRSWDVTALAAGWLEGRYPNHGMLLSLSAGIASLRFTSSDSVTPTDRPKLVLTYVPPCGAVNPPQDDTEPGLVARWKLDETSGTAVSDLGGTHPGTLSAGAWTGGLAGGALALDGSGQAVTVPHVADLSIDSAVTVMAWVHNRSLTGYDAVLNKGATGNNSNYRLGTRDRELDFEFYDGGWRAFQTTGLNLETDTWYHVAASFDDATNAIRLYVNGALVLSTSSNRHMAVNAEPLLIGNDPSGGSWDGRLDEVRVYNIALTAAAIAGAMKGSAPVAAADAMVADTDTGKNYGATQLLQAQGAAPNRRALFRFDTSGYAPGTAIERAVLSVYLDNLNGSGNPATLTVHPITEAWVEGTLDGGDTTAAVTWAQRGTGPWTTPGGSFGAAAGSVTVPAGFATKQPIQIDITGLVREWIDGARPNHGVIVLSGDGTEFKVLSREAPNGAPQLLISLP